MSSRRGVDRVSSRWYRRATGLLGLALLVVVLGTGLAHALGERSSPAIGQPLAALSLAPDPAIWTTPLSRVSFARLSDARPRVGQPLGLALPRLDGVTVAAAGDAAVVALVILARLGAVRDHGVRAPPRFGRANDTSLLGT